MNRKRFAKFLGRSLIVSGLDQGHAKMIVGLGKVRTQLDGLPKLLDHHLRISSRLAQQKSQSVVSQGIVGFLLDRLLYCINGEFQVWNLVGLIFLVRLR